MILGRILQPITSPILSRVLLNIDYPVNTVAPVVSGITYNGQTMSTTNGTWTNSPTSYTYQWLSNGVYISGATSSTYAVTSITEGTSISCNVTAINSAGQTTQVSNAIENWILTDDPGGIMWGDPSDTARISDTGGSVTQLDDKIGAFNLTQVPGSATPTTGIDTFNGLNVLSCDGNDFLITTNPLVYDNVVGNLSFFAISQLDVIDNATDSIYSVVQASGVPGNTFQFQSNNAVGFNGGILSNSPFIALTGGPFQGSPIIYETVFDFGTQTITALIDGTVRGSGVGFTSSIASPTFLRYFSNRGATTQPVGKMSEIFVTTSIDSTNREKVEGYFAHKYATTASLPALHPYKTNAPTV